RSFALTLMAALSIPAAAAAQSARPDAVPLTLDEAVQRAIEHNPDLAIVRLDTEVEAARVGQSRAAYTPTFSTTAGRSRNVTPPANALSATTGLDVQDWFSSTGVTQRVPWGGGTWSVSWDAARTATNSPISSFDPNLQSGIQLAFSQPILRDRAIDVPRRTYLVAKRDRDSSERRFHESLVQTIAGVKQAYWTLK